MAGLRLRTLPATCLVASLLAAALTADGGPNHQVSSNSYGVSGGNVNDRSRAFCCGGTLGSLITDGTVQYVLSNNHVLARSGSASVGEDVTQPGLIDNSCLPSEIVADLSNFPPLGSNVDAAPAQLRTGAMDADGNIMDIGTISSTIKAPEVGLAVTKSGRTTGLTASTVEAINASVSVRYRAGCGTGRQFTVSYTGQVVVGGSGFSAGGDSGSLIVTSDSAHQPVGLLFAGSSTSTIANPAGEVLTKVSQAIGKQLSFVGDPVSFGIAAALSESEVQEATAVKDRFAPGLMSNPAVILVGVGADDQIPGRAVIVIHLQAGAAATVMPATLGGFRTRVRVTDPIQAWGWNAPAGVSCK